MLIEVVSLDLMSTIAEFCVYIYICIFIAEEFV